MVKFGSSEKKLLPLLVILVLFFCLSLLTGRYPSPGIISPFRLLEDPLAMRLLTQLRLPRVTAALLLGMSLGAAGTVFQMIFANPLVEPGFLGVSQGAAFGAAFSIVFISTSSSMVQFSAAFFAFLGLGSSYLLARKFHFGGWILKLILSGIAVSALLSSGVGMLKYLADPMSQLPEITFWMLGGLWAVSWDRITSIIPTTIISLAVIYIMRWRLNILSMDDRTAFSLGAAPVRERIILLTAATAAVAAVISVSGIVGWVGLIVPHIARKIYSSDARRSIPASMMIGGIYVVACDTIGRTLLHGELPLGVVTSFLGAGLFIILLTRPPASVKVVKTVKTAGESQA